ncbi:MAG TPA: pseudouridine synthase [Bacillota bacterium]|nr:pseudouridine synthase [Bacillota bacterium]
MRLDRLLANMGSGSRAEVKKMIKTGRVMVNGLVCRDPGQQVNVATEQVLLDNETVSYQQYIYLMLNKPAGVISATEDLRERTVLDLVDPKYYNKGLFPVGRLDKDTEGLLLLTNHGELGHQLLSPKKHVVKRYFARIAGVVTVADQEAFREGIILDDGYRTLPGNLEILTADEVSEVSVAIREGKFHQIKRMFLALGKPVLYLKRYAMGSLVLDERLPLGSYRELEKEEIERLTGETG